MTTTSAPAPLLPLVFFVTAVMAATRAAFPTIPRSGPLGGVNVRSELVPGIGLTTRSEMGAACAAVCEVIDLGGTRDQAIAAIVEVAYSGMTTAAAIAQARTEADHFLTWVEGHADTDYAEQLRGPWS